MNAKSVLLIEDDATVRSAVDLLLSERGFDVVSAASVAEARKAITSHRPGFHVAICDMVLEDRNSKTTGATLARELVERHRAWPPEVIFFSAHGDVEFYRAALLVGAACYLRKGDPTHRELIEHVGVLALRCALRDD